MTDSFEGDIERILVAHRALASSYADILRLADSPPTLKQYALFFRDEAQLSGSFVYWVFLPGTLGFLFLALILSLIFKPAWQVILFNIMFGIVVILLLALILTKFSRRVLWPIIARLVCNPPLNPGH